MAFWKYDELSAVHIELSTNCNAACPGCPRFLCNSPLVDPNLDIQAVTYESFIKWFPKELTKNIYNWIICGNYGDPMTCKDIYPILEYICENSQGNIQINTNGGVRSAELFTKIGELFVKHKCNSSDEITRAITFSIDGLSDTNHLYRRNVKWEKVWENLMAYVDTGADACWDFLQFKHNVHQINEAKELAKKYGINFVLKNPFGVDKQAMPVYDKKLKLEYIIEHAIDNGYPAFSPAPINFIAPLPSPLPAGTSGCINCMAKRKGPTPYQNKTITELFVSVAGRVLPCCFVGNRMNITHMSDAVEGQHIQNKIGNLNSLHHYSMKEILDSEVLEVWSRSWETKSVRTCWDQCGSSDNKARAIDTLLKDAN